MPSADDVIVQRAVEDFEEGLVHLRAELRRTHGRIVGAALDAAMTGAVNALDVRDMMRDDVRHLVGLAHQVNAGADARKLAEENLERVLRMKHKMAFIAREKDPEFRVVLDLARACFAARLVDLARMAAVDSPKDYDDLVRRAFPERAHVDRIVEENAAFVRDVVAHLETHPQLLRVPQALVPKLAQTARDFIAWKVDAVRRGVDQIYAAPGA